MPYSNIDELPENVRASLPEHGQEIFMNAFNSALNSTCKDSEDPEACAFRVAWAAVKKVYSQNEDGEWVRKEESEEKTMENLPDPGKNVKFLEAPIKNTRIRDTEDGGIIVEGVPLLAAGTWRVGYGTLANGNARTIHYGEKVLRQYAKNWKNRTGYSKHMGIVPRDVTEMVGDVHNIRYENGAIRGDVRLHGATQHSRDTIELIKRGIVSYVSVEHTGEEQWNPELKRYEAKSLEFIGFAFVQRGACEKCKIQEYQETLNAGEDMEIKELEKKIGDLEAELKKLRTESVQEKTLSEIQEKVTMLTEQITTLSRQPTSPVVVQSEPGDPGTVELIAVIDRASGIVRGA